MASFDAVLKQSGLYKPEEYEQKAGEIETGRQAAMEPYVARGKERATREETLRKQVAGMKTPAAPGLQPLPDAPQQQYKDPLQALGGMGMLLALAGSLATRAPLTSALDSMASAIEGFHKGDKESMELGRKNWKDSFDKAMSQNNTELDSYNALLQKSSGDLAKAQAEMHVIAAQNKDDTMLAALESGNFERQEQILKDRQTMGEKMATLQSNHEIRSMLYGGGASNIDSNTLRSRAAMIASGVPVNVAVPGQGRMAVHERQQAQQAAVQMFVDQGMTPEQAGQKIAQAQLNYKGTGGAVNLLKKLEASNTQIIKQLDFNAEQAKEQMVKLARSDVSPALNAIANGVQFWTGEPELGPLFYYMQATMMEGARLQAGAGASVAQLHSETVEMAKKWADVRMTPAMWDKLTEAVKKEGSARMRFTKDALGETMDNIVPTSLPPGVKPPQGGNVLRFDARGNMIQ